MLIAITWLAVVFNIAYVVLAIQQLRISWIMGMAGVLLAGWVYFEERLFSDALLQIFYFGLSIYGWLRWRPDAGGTDLKIFSMLGYEHVISVGVGVAIGVLLGFILSGAGASYPFADGLTTGLSLVATWLVARRYIENWLYWIVIDAACIVIYVQKEIWPFVGLFALYIVLAIFGWKKWNKLSAVQIAEQSGIS